MIPHEPESAGTNALGVLMQPMGDAPLPVCEMRGYVPVISWKCEGIHGHLDIQLGNVDNPGEFCRRLARQITAFSFDVDAAREQREPSAIGGGL